MRSSNGFNVFNSFPIAGVQLLSARLNTSSLQRNGRLPTADQNSPDQDLQPSLNQRNGTPLMSGFNVQHSQYLIPTSTPQQVPFGLVGHTTQHVQACSGQLEGDVAVSSQNGSPRPFQPSGLVQSPTSGNSSCTSVVGCLDFSFLGPGGQQLQNTGKPVPSYVPATWDQQHRSVMTWGPEQVCEWLAAIGLRSIREVCRPKSQFV